MDKVNIKIVRMSDGVKIPTKRSEDAGHDLAAHFEEKFITIHPNTSVLIPTGIKTIIPPTHYAQIFERGSTGVKNMKFNAGVIDSGFRGEWKVCLYNGNDIPIVIAKDTDEEETTLQIQWLRFEHSDVIVYPYEKAIAQFVVLPVPQTTIEEVTEEEFNQYGSERGEGMLGDSGK